MWKFVGRPRRRKKLLIWVALLPFLAATGGARLEAEPPPAEGAPPTASTHHLHSATDLASSGRYLYAFEHLRRVEPSELNHEEVQAFASCLVRLVVHQRRELPLWTPGFAALVETCRRPRFVELPSCWMVRALWYTARGPVEEGLEAWQMLLEQKPKNRQQILSAALAYLERASHTVFPRDPQVQSGAVFRFLDRWASDPALKQDPEIRIALARFEARLDAESKRSQEVLDSLVRELSADPKALDLRGNLEEARGRYDRALPWRLWAAYTANSRLREDSPAYWGKLGSLYVDLGWPEASQAAYQRSDVEPRDRRSIRPKDRPAHGPELSEDCRLWHDGLLGYHPQRLVREEGFAWTKLVQDLQRWEQRCRLPEPGSLCLDRNGHGPLRPRFTARELHRLPTSGNRAESLRCLAERSPLWIPEVAELFAGRPGEELRQEPAYWYAQGLVAARRGMLREALKAWEMCLERTPEAPARAWRYDHIIRELASTPVRILRSEPAALRRFLDSPQPLRRSGAPMSTTLFNRSTVEMNLSPASSEARSASDHTLVVSSLDAKSLRQRGRRELLCGRPDRALPWLRWSKTSDFMLAMADTAFGGWKGAEELLPSTGPGTTRHRLDPSCRKILDDLADQDLHLLLARHGADWQDFVPGFRRWQEECSLF